MLYMMHLYDMQGLYIILMEYYHGAVTRPNEPTQDRHINDGMSYQRWPPFCNTNGRCERQKCVHTCIAAPHFSQWPLSPTPPQPPNPPILQPQCHEVLNSIKILKMFKTSPSRLCCYGDSVQSCSQTGHTWVAKRLYAFIHQIHR